MERRLAIKRFLVTVGGIMLIPGIAHKVYPLTIELKEGTGDKEKFFAELAETIIPTTNTPGAKSLAVQLYVLTMLSDCYAKEVNVSMDKSLKYIDELSVKQFGISFIQGTKDQRESMLRQVENNECPQEVTASYQIIKDLTIGGYLGSEYVMTKVFNYEMVPARYNGFFPVKTLE